jgi:hypothetical protein
MTLLPKSFVAFLRSPAQWTLVLCTAAVVLFLQIFAYWNFRPGLFSELYFFVKVAVWLSLAIGMGLLAHFGFDRLTDWLARSEEPRSKDKSVPGATLFPRN